MSHRRTFRRRNQSAIFETIESRTLFSATLTTLASFPNYDLAQGGTVVVNGNIFGTTQAIGNSQGTLYELPKGSDTINTLVVFNGNNGSNPGSSLIVDAAGNIYGTTATGGTSNYGTVWELPVNATNITRLASFNGINGNQLGNGVAMYNGNIFVVAEAGPSGNGALLEIPQGASSLTPVTSFLAGSNPIGRPVVDTRGDIFGVTATGGDNGLGSIYEIPAGGTPLTLVSFIVSDPTPQGDLLIDSSGNLFGTTESVSEGQTISTVYEYPANSGEITTLANKNSTDGTYIEQGLARDSHGDLFGSVNGGVGDPSVVFEIPATNGSFSPALAIASIPEVDNNGFDENAATGYLGLDATGNLYGTTQSTNPNTFDSIFEIAGAAVAQVGSQLSVVQQPTQTIVDEPITPPITVDVLDSNNNPVTSDNSPVSIRLAGGPPGAVLGGTLTVDAVNGVATFSNLNINTVGTYTFSFTAPNMSSATTSTFRIIKSPLDGSHLVFTLPPGPSTVAGQKLQEFIVSAETSSGTASTKTKGSVLLSITSGPTGGKILGSKTAPLKKGIAKFLKVSFNIAGTYTLEAQDSASIQATPQTFNITATTPRKMSFIQQPPTKLAPSTPFAVSVELKDKYGNIAANDNSGVTLNLPGLEGTLTENVVDGIAAFNDLSLVSPGHYTIKAVDPFDNLKATARGLRIT